MISNSRVTLPLRFELKSAHAHCIGLDAEEEVGRDRPSARYADVISNSAAVNMRFDTDRLELDADFGALAGRWLERRPPKRSAPRFGMNEVE